MSVDETGVASSVAQTPTEVDMLTDPFQVTSGRVWIEYCAGGILTVYLNNDGDEKPVTPVLTTTVQDLPFVADETVYVGFSAGTGTLAAIHDVTTWTFDAGTCAAE